MQKYLLQINPNLTERSLVNENRTTAFSTDQVQFLSTKNINLQTYILYKGIKCI